MPQANQDEGHTYYSFEEVEKRFYPADEEQELYDLSDPAKAGEKLAEVSWNKVKDLLCLD